MLRLDCHGVAREQCLIEFFVRLDSACVRPFTAHRFANLLQCRHAALRALADPDQMLAQLRQAGNTVDVSTLGDSLLLDYQFDALPAGEVAKLFGAKFAVELGELPAGQWQGPIESGYGVHLVRISERTEGRMPALEQVREAVRREWANARRVEANEKFYQALLARYTVTIEAQHPAENTDKKQLANARR